MHANQPHDTAFKQQRLRAWQPLLTPRTVIAAFALTGALFVAVGAVMVSLGSGVFEAQLRYDDKCSTNGICITDELTVDADVSGPIFFYYKIENFYQNHRRFVKSRDDRQLRNLASDLDDCSPLIHSPVLPAKLLYPCGLVANSFFNDVISAKLTEPGQSSARVLSGDSWSNADIIWSSDTKKFISAPNDSSLYSDPNKFTQTSSRVDQSGTITLPAVDDPDLIVWMRIAALPTFRKLYRRRSDGLTAGSKLQFSVQNHFDVSAFGGKKFVVVASASPLGGKNVFLSWAYIVVGILCLATAAAFLAKQVLAPRKLGDFSQWQRNNSS